MIESLYQKKTTIKCFDTETRFPIECLNVRDTTELEIIGGNFTYFPPDISELKHLKKFSLISTKVSQLPAEIFSLPKLEYLNLKNNRIESLPPLFKDNQIKELILGRNFLSEEALTTFFGAFKELLVLDLGHNLLRDIPESLFSLKELRRLNLENNQLKRLHPRLKNLENLGHLSLTNNPFSMEERAQITRDYNIEF